MVITISGVVLLGIFIYFFFRRDNLKFSHALICALFGFSLAGTALAPGIRAGGAGLADMLGAIRF